MNVLKGTFRLSIVLGIASLGIFWWLAVREASDDAQKSWELWWTLRCAGYLLKLDTKPMENDFGNIDLGKHTHCSERQFWANRREIAEALQQEESPYQARFDEIMRWKRDLIWQSALAMVVLTNLLGVGFLGLRAALRWVGSGYRGQ